MRALKDLLESSAVARFLVCGGSAAAINWVARIGLSLVMPFEAAIIVAYMIGMTVGFLLYRHLVWPGQAAPWQSQVTPFLVVNGVGAVIVLAVAVGLERGLAMIVGPSALVEAFAHGTAIGVGAVANYIGHSRITFAR